MSSIANQVQGWIAAQKKPGGPTHILNIAPATGAMLRMQRSVVKQFVAGCMLTLSVLFYLAQDLHN